MQIYERHFEVHACHFNDDGYAKYHDALSALRAQDLNAAEDKFNAVLRCIHGHNFKISVFIAYDDAAGNGWAIEDGALRQIVECYHGTNISMLPAFLHTRARATTENIAVVIADEVWSALQSVVGLRSLRIRVQETSDIVAESHREATRCCGDVQLRDA